MHRRKPLRRIRRVRHWDQTGETQTGEDDTADIGQPAESKE